MYLELNTSYKSTMDIALIEKIFKSRKANVLNDYRLFSVFVPLVNIEDSLHVLFEIRSSNLKRQPNEICFPGGKVEPNETPRDCAIRETSEELNIEMNHIRLMSELDYIITYSNFILYSFLGELKYEDVKTMKVNLGEVKDTFLVPLEYFLKEDPLCYEMEVAPKSLKEDFPYHLIQNGKDYNWRKGKMPIYIYQYKDKVIWGLTARILYNMIKIMRQQNR